MKYMGSKARFVKELLPIILMNRKAGQWYVEPFAGGMNVICHVNGNRLANDINTPLIEMWKKLLTGWQPPRISKNQYNQIKAMPEKYPPHLVGWVGFNCAYSGKFFGGYAGVTKTKTGVIRDYQAEALKNTLKQVTQLQGVKFENKPYWNLELPLNSIIYCDPPYRHTTSYKHPFNHVKFWNWVRQVKAQGHTVFISEYEAPADFECIWEKQAKSSLSANGKSGGSKTSIEKLFK